MVRLEKEHIQFIENYLENSDILYADIRLEMTDHVASEIEQLMESNNLKFYETFKSYMVSNKVTLLDNNQQFIRAADKTILKTLAVQLYKIQTLLIFCTVLLISFKWLTTIEVENLRGYMTLFPIISIVPFLIVYAYFLIIFKTPRFSGIERLGYFYIMSFQVFNFLCLIMGLYIQNKGNFYIVAIFMAIILTMSLLIIKITLKIVNQYRTDYTFMTSY